MSAMLLVSTGCKERTKPDMCAGMNPVIVTYKDWQALSQAGRDRITKNNCDWAYYCSESQFKEANCPKE